MMAGPPLGPFQEEALETGEEGHLQVVGPTRRGDTGQDGRGPGEGVLGMARALEEGSSEGQGDPDALGVPSERLRGLEPPFAAWAELGWGSEILG